MKPAGRALRLRRAILLVLALLSVLGGVMPTGGDAFAQGGQPGAVEPAPPPSTDPAGGPAPQAEGARPGPQPRGEPAEDGRQSDPTTEGAPQGPPADVAPQVGPNAQDHGQLAALSGQLVDGTSQACSDFKLKLDLLLGAIDIYDLSDEGWVWVDPARKFRSVSGLVTRSEIPNNDTPSNHNAHDQNTDILVDPGYESLLSRNGKDSPNDARLPDTIEMEWEIGGHSDSGELLPHRGFPQWAWPSVGDRVWTDGHWTYDCGHPKEIDGATRYRTEIHPARAIATMRDQARSLPGTGQNIVPVTATDLYIHGDGGYITQVLNCGMEIILSDNPSSCPVKTNPIDVDFEFDIYLPPRPSSKAVLAMYVENGPGNTVGLAPVLEPRAPTRALNGYDPSTVLHVTVPLAGSGVTPDQVYARKIYAGWVFPYQDIRHLRLTLNRMDLHNDQDPDPGDCECTYFWMNVNRSPTNEWIRLADFANGNMHDYDDDGGSGDGYMTFSDAVFDFYLRPGQDYTVRAHGYDQDCYDDWYGIRAFPLYWTSCKADVTFEYGNNDPFNKLTKTFVAPGYGVGSQDVTANNQYELEFQVAEVALPAPSANIGVSQSCRPQQPLSGSTFTCTISVRNNGPGLPQDLKLNGTLTTGLPASSYTIGMPTFTYSGRSTSPFGCSRSGASFSCNIETLPDNGTAVVRYDVTARQGGSFTSSVSYSSNTPDPISSNNQDSDTVSVVQQTGIDIRPGLTPNTIKVSPPANDTIIVAILSSASFDAAGRINPATLTFGRTGSEPSLLASTVRTGDYNGDGLPDLVARFDNYPALFTCADTQGILRAQTYDGTLVEGRDSVAPAPCS